MISQSIRWRQSLGGDSSAAILESALTVHRNILGGFKREANAKNTGADAGRKGRESLSRGRGCGEGF